MFLSEGKKQKKCDPRAPHHWTELIYESKPLKPAGRQRKQWMTWLENSHVIEKAGSTSRAKKTESLPWFQWSEWLFHFSQCFLVLLKKPILLNKVNLVNNWFHLNKLWIINVLPWRTRPAIPLLLNLFGGDCLLFRGLHAWHGIIAFLLFYDFMIFDSVFAWSNLRDVVTFRQKTNIETIDSRGRRSLLKDVFPC
jgi:hypothetical protein